jgi:hypothetical protein
MAVSGDAHLIMQLYSSTTAVQNAVMIDCDFISDLQRTMQRAVCGNKSIIADCDLTAWLGKYVC